MKEIVENKIDLTLPEDIQKITSKTRESYYFLKSLENLFTNHVVLKDGFDKNLFEERVNRIKDCKKEFHDFENKLYFQGKSKLKKDDKYKVEIDLNVLIGISVKYLKLKEKIDDLQLEILEYLFLLENDLVSALSEKQEFLKPLVTQYTGNTFIYSAFQHSADEDKFDNYRLYLSDKSASKLYSKSNSYPVPVKIRNNDFLIKKYRELYQKVRTAQIAIIGNISRLQEEESIKKMTIEQFKVNKKINRLTILTSIIALIGLVYASISTFFLITDNSIEIQSESDMIEHRILHDIKNEIKNNIGSLSHTDSLLHDLSKNMEQINIEN